MKTFHLIESPTILNYNLNGTSSAPKTKYNKSNYHKYEPMTSPSTKIRNFEIFLISRSKISWPEIKSKFQRPSNKGRIFEFSRSLK